MRDKLTPSKVLKYFALIYVVCSLFYATGHLLGLGKSSSNRPSIAPRSAADDKVLSVSELQERYHGTQQVTWGNTDENTSEDLMLSKVFSDAMGPSKVIPYYFKAEESADSEEVTIATLVTHNRFKVLSRLATRYKGPISVAIHVNDDASKQEILTDLHRLYDDNPDMRRYVDLHLVVDKFDRQFNMWRNVAKFFARTEYIMMLDVDFYLCTDFRKSLKANPQLMDILRSGTGAIVVPAFEYLNADDGEDWNDFPTNKGKLMQEVQDGKLDMFHITWKPGHGATNYTRWYGTTEPYKVVDYTFSYEPYVIFKKEGTPWCEERFIGYGANKAACLYEIYLAGIDYWVLPDDFLIHQTHHYPLETRAKERTYNKKLYSYFREEVCLRYSRTMIAAGLWDSSRADNVKRECAKIKGFNDIVTRMIG
ncbi:glycosyl-transferase for dystroglycan-domain-containing protein [Phascolomyces articulosus]|uniref:Glycosyl-transferase for dystroglycan-domain-containing protein n=1 Tax=Phascolomyces articulosus TaxID=60185 RepID=A0AAD5PHI6_9FUNG|nr:glycosyl-transferase for dystroglycan-domain-containing protein [Phascolomyces articulosus]